MTADVVLVIHGVANTDEPDFDRRVQGLQDFVGDGWKLVPVFWNPLGAQIEGIADTYPRPWDEGVRGVEPTASPQASTAGLLMLNDGAAPPTTRGGGVDDARKAIVIAAALDVAADSTGDVGVAVRGAASGPVVSAVIEDEWASLLWLKYVDDPQLLKQVGRLVGQAGGTTAGITRGPIDDITGVVKAALHGADDLVGTIIGRVGGVLHYALRSVLTPRFGKGMGDVFVYQRHRDEIQAYVRDKLDDLGNDLGTERSRVSIIGHSLGGIIAFDMATRSDNPLYLDALITFGSQSSILHVLDPRGGAIAPYAPPSHVVLPDTIRHWTNIWEPWDPLAFAATPVFAAADGATVADRWIPHLSSTPLWSHSIYWEQEDARAEIKAALESAKKN
jgi:hypothetical protein